MLQQHRVEVRGTSFRLQALVGPMQTNTMSRHVFGNHSVIFGPVIRNRSRLLDTDRRRPVVYTFPPFKIMVETRFLNLHRFCYSLPMFGATAQTYLMMFDSEDDIGSGFARDAYLFQ